MRERMIHQLRPGLDTSGVTPHPAQSARRAFPNENRRRAGEQHCASP